MILRLNVFSTSSLACLYVSTTGSDPIFYTKKTVDTEFSCPLLCQ